MPGRPLCRSAKSTTAPTASALCVRTSSSASSSTSACRSPVFTCAGSSRASVLGVATSTCGGRSRSSCSVCALTSPTTLSTRSARSGSLCLPTPPSASATPATWCASSRVGVTTMRRRRVLAALPGSMRASSGSRYASVLPLPVSE
jgi:hypothetical protein